MKVPSLHRHTKKADEPPSAPGEPAEDDFDTQANPNEKPLFSEKYTPQEKTRIECLPGLLGNGRPAPRDEERPRVTIAKDAHPFAHLRDPSASANQAPAA
jgi:hypothetical protein